MAWGINGGKKTIKHPTLGHPRFKEQWTQFIIRFELFKNLIRNPIRFGL